MALAVAAPVLWAVSDWIITGEPFFSLTNTRDTAETLGRPRGIENVPEIMPRRLGEILRWVPLIGGAAGFVLAMTIARRQARVPAAVAVVSGFGFVLIGIAGLSLLGRYLLLPAAMLCVFFGFAAFGWLRLAEGAVARSMDRRRGGAAGGLRGLDHLPPERSPRPAARRHPGARPHAGRPARS